MLTIRSREGWVLVVLVYGQRYPGLRHAHPLMREWAIGLIPQSCPFATIGCVCVFRKDWQLTASIPQNEFSQCGIYPESQEYCSRSQWLYLFLLDHDALQVSSSGFYLYKRSFLQTKLLWKHLPQRKLLTKSLSTSVQTNVITSRKQRQPNYIIEILV